MAKEKAIRELEDLPGIGEVAAEKLKNAGIKTLDAIAAFAPHDLAEIAGIGVESAKKAVQAAKESTTIDYTTADVVYERRKAIGKITTGVESLNELIGGGVETGAITESYGRFASGKSQIGFQLTVNVQLPREKGGLAGRVLFLDTEGTFRPERIAAIAVAAGMTEEEALKNIIVVRAGTTEQQILTIERADKLIAEQNIRLIVVDSITSLFRSEFLGRGALGRGSRSSTATYTSSRCWRTSSTWRYT